MLTVHVPSTLTCPQSSSRTFSLTVVLSLPRVKAMKKHTWSKRAFNRLPSLDNTTSSVSCFSSTSSLPSSQLPETSSLSLLRLRPHTGSEVRGQHLPSKPCRRARDRSVDWRSTRQSVSNLPWNHRPLIVRASSSLFICP